MNFGFWCSEWFLGQLRPKITICCSLGRQKRGFGPLAPLSYFLYFTSICVLAPGRTILTNLVAYNAKKANSRKKAAVFVISGLDLPRTAGCSQKVFLTVIGPKFERFHVL